MTARLRRLEDLVVRLLPISRSFLRFALVGSLGLVINQAILLTLTGVGLAVPIASAIASEVAVVNNYICNELWSFSGDRLSWRRLAMFNATALVGIVITAGVVTVLSATTSLPLVVANLVAVAAATVWNFLASAKWTFRRGRGSGPDGPTTGEDGHPDAAPRTVTTS